MLARCFAPWPRRSPDDALKDEEVCNYVDALQAYLLKDSGKASELLRRNLDKFKKRSSSKGFRLNYCTLSTTLLGTAQNSSATTGSRWPTSACGPG